MSNPPTSISHAVAVADPRSNNQIKVESDGSINVNTAGGSTAVSKANAAHPTYIEGSTNPLSTDLFGSERVHLTDPADGSDLTPVTLGQAAMASSLPVAIASNQSAVPVSGTVTANQGGAPWSVSGTVAATQSGAWTVAATQSGAWSVSITGTPTVTISGTVAATQSGTWTVQPGNTANTTPWLTTINQGGNSATVSAAGALKVDGSAVTQPVSGTVAATQSGTWNTGLGANVATESYDGSTVVTQTELIQVVSLAYEMRQMLGLLAQALSLAPDPGTGRLRVLLESVAASTGGSINITNTTLSNLTTTVGAISATAGGGNKPDTMIFDAMQNAWANSVLPCIGRA